MSDNIQEVQIGTSRYAPPEASAINLYTFNGQAGMTLTQLVMAVCIQRAATTESAAVLKSNQVSQSSGLLNALSKCVTIIMEGDGDYFLDSRALDLGDTGYKPKNVGEKTTVFDFLTKELGINLGTSTVTVSPGDSRFSNMSTKFKEDLATALKSTDSYKVTMEELGHYDPIGLLQREGYTNVWDSTQRFAKAIAFSLVGATLVAIPFENNILGDFLTRIFIRLNNSFSLTNPFTFNTSAYYVQGQEGRMSLFNQLKRKIEDATNLSQELVLDLQSCTSRRDVAYNMSTNIGGAMLASLAFVAAQMR